MAILRSEMSVRQATEQINRVLLELDFAQLAELEALQKGLALQADFTYLLGPIKIALRPRIISPEQLRALQSYCTAMWGDCLTLEKMWLAGELDAFIDIEEEELEIARLQPWRGGPAIFAADGLFSFGAHPEDP
jgi:hypothetical protein